MLKHCQWRLCFIKQPKRCFERYVPLAAEAIPQSRTILRKVLGGVFNEDTGETKAIDLTDLMALHQRLVITGGPGCGKITILQNLAWTLAQAIINDDPTLAKDRLVLTKGTIIQTRSLPDN